MAKEDPLLDQISHFQHKLEKYAKNGETDKVLYYIHKLKHLHVTVKHLEETGVGRSVNSLRHNEGLVGEKARDLVNKWKEMVSAEEEEEEEEEEEHEGNEEDEFEKQSDCDSGMEEAEDEEEDDRLQIQEEVGDERSIPEYKPTSANAYRYGSESPGGGNDCSYNPLTSQMDYQLVSGSEPTREYHPSSIGEHNSYDSSPEGDQNSGLEDASPNVSSDRRNGNTSSRGSSKKSSKADKERHKKKDKDRDKEKHKDSSASHSKEKKKDHKDKHRAKHKDKDKDREEKKEKNKSHKHKDKERHGEKSRERKNDESVEKSRTEPEKEKKKEMINGYATSEMEYKSHTVKHSKENNKREEEDKHRDKSGIHRKEERSREKENREKEISENKEKESSDSEYVRERDTSSRDDRNKEKEKQKHRDKHGSGKKDKGKHDSKCLENQREISEDSESTAMENKKKKSKSNPENDCDFGAALMGFDSPLKKKKKKKKKERKEHESSDDEKPSSSKSSHKRALSEGGDLPDSKKPRLLEKPPQSLPKLPSSFSDAALESPLLPEINPNYKPLPRVPLKDDRPQVSDKMSEEETFNIMMQLKSSRRGKMYSGRVTGLQSVPTLKQCCIRVMIDYIDAIEYTGNVPYDILKPVLDRATPQQLLNIEDFNPNLLEDTDEIWEVHCRRDFRNDRRDDMESWRDLYLRCFDTREKKLKSLTENLQQKFISKAEPRRQTKLAFVNTAVKVPRCVARAQAKHGTGTPSGSVVKPGKAAEIAARKAAMQNAQRAEKAVAAPRPSAAKNKKVAPLMAKTRQFYKKAFRR